MKKAYFRGSGAILLVLMFFGIALGSMGKLAFPRFYDLNYFWPGIVVQYIGCSLFGWTGILAGVLFPLISNALCDDFITDSLFFTVGNFLQCFLFYYFSDYFRLTPIKRSNFLRFIFIGVMFPVFLGSLCSLLAMMTFDRLAPHNLHDAFNLLLLWNINSAPLVIIFAPKLINNLFITKNYLQHKEKKLKHETY